MKPKPTKPLNNRMERVREFRFMKPTNDNWAPSFEGNLCECRGFVVRTGPNFWSKIIVSGNDDYSLEKEFHGTRMECLDFYQEWFSKLEKMSLIVQKELKEMGFGYL